MVEQYINNVRSYEVSIWTLQDRFVSILKWSNMTHKGLILDPEITLRDDGTQEFTFTIPQYYLELFDRIPNPLWMHLDLQPLEANMHKLKVIFNKNTKDEKVFEFLVVSVTEDHNLDLVDITVKSEGLAFHELGKTGYRINLAQDNFEVVENEWFDNSYDYATGTYRPRPLMNILFWNDLIFKDSDGNWRTNWTYEILMDWSAFSNDRKMKKSEDISEEPYGRYSDILYEDAYVASWDMSGDSIKPRTVESLREKERPIEISESNYYNVTQTIAELFGVFCRYEYEYNDRYEIIGRKVIYYNNYMKDAEVHMDLTYPYSSSSITRTTDNTELTTKLYVHSVDDSDYGTLSIMDVEANKSKEDYLLNFDYLIKIGALNPELIEDLKQFETDIRYLNTVLTDTQERIRAIENQLTEVSANVTYYDNAIKLDSELYRKAQEQKDSLTDSGGYKPANRVFTVMGSKDDNEYGYYINITIEGLDGSSVALYESRKALVGTYGYGYENPINSFRCIYDEYGNVIRILNIGRVEDLIDDSLIYLVGQYNPKSKYDNIIKTWNLRLAIDTKKYNEAAAKETLLNWYLHGSRVGYGIADGIKLDGDYIGLGVIWDEDEESGTAPIDPDGPNYNKYLDYTLDMRVWGKDDYSDKIWKLENDAYVVNDKITEDPFEDYLADNSTPELYYHYEFYTKRKERTVNSFERMMGPALREGYWLPEDYNDYGDTYYDNFVIGLKANTPYLSFIWDYEKYYDNEEPLLYTANTNGDVKLHIIIDLTDYLSEIEGHLDNLFFGYYDPIVFLTVKELEDAVNKLNSEISELDTEELESTTYINLALLKTYYTNNPLNINIYSTVIGEENRETTVEIPANGENLSSFYLSELNVKITNLLERILDIEVNSATIMELLNYINSTINSFIAFTNSWVTIERNSKGTHGSHITALNTEKNKLTNLLKIVNKAISWYGYKQSVANLISTINANKDGSYRTYQIGSDCELGYIINKSDKNTIIPVLIVTGTDTVSDDILKYLNTGLYTYYSGITDEHNVKIMHTIDITDLDTSFPSSSFIGYGKDKNDTAISTFIPLNISDRGPYINLINTYTPLTENVDGANLPMDVYNYEYARVYPRLYFSSLKLRNTSSKLRVKLNMHELTVNEDYLIVTDDRSTGITTSGVGYYLTIRDIVLYNESKPWALDVLYTLLNADTSIYLDALKVSKENALPKVSYDVELSILNPDFIKTAYNLLNRIVHINDNDLKLEEVSGYISAVTLKLNKPWEDTVEVKNYLTKFEDLFSTIVAQTEAMKKSEGGISNAVKAFTANGFIDSDVLLDSMLKADLNLQFNSGTLTISLADGIWGVSDAGVVAFRGGGIFTATTRDVNGNWKWNTGILPSGINADLITSGQLDTNKIKIYAGNELRFLMNGSGLYAYKGYSEDEYNTLVEGATSEEIAEIKQQMNDSVKKLYLLYNSEGLFLRAEAGAYVLKEEPVFLDAAKLIPVYKQYTTEVNGTYVVHYEYDTITGERIQETKPVYSVVNAQVDRVEVSWEGFILRNWAGEKVFYADPDTGNLTLKGYVEASGGMIGGWTLGENRLTSNGISLISGPLEAAGILLAPTGLRQTSVTDPLDRTKVYYIYEEVTSHEYYYLKFDSLYEITIDENSTDKVYITTNKLIIRPLYIEEVETYADGTPVENNYAVANESDGGNSLTITLNTTLERNEITVTTHVYIKESESAQDYIKDSNDNYIEYDSSDTTYAWFDAIVDKYSENDYMTFISITYIPLYNEYTLDEHERLTLRPVGNDEATFSVSAATGKVTILSGTLGNVTIVKDLGLEGGTISKAEFKSDNTFTSGEEVHSFGELFYDFTIDGNTGEITLHRVNGNDVNFNIAATSFYKNAIAAAGAISLTVTVNNLNVSVVADQANPQKKTSNFTVSATARNTVEAVARSGTSSVTKTVTIEGAGDVQRESGTGICTDCHASCFHNCAKACTNGSNATPTCEVNCIGGCKSSCSETCKTACSNGCGSGCTNNCTNGCGNTCKDGCDTGCKTTCYNGCYTHCGTSCNIQCGLGCANDCGDYCTGHVGIMPW